MASTPCCGIDLEEVGRVGDATLCERPCQRVEDPRSLVPVKQSGKCLEEELLHYQRVLPECNVFNSANGLTYCVKTWNYSTAQ